MLLKRTFILLPISLKISNIHAISDAHMQKEYAWNI